MRKKMMGGGMMQRPMYKKGSKVKKLSKNKKFKRDGVEFDKPLGPKGTFSTGNPPKRYEVAKGGRIKKMDGGRAKGLIPEAQEKAKSMTVKSSKRRVKKMGGGSLKAVPADNKGLKKLPTEVRNKMGFMKKGGVVSDTKKKQFKANQAGQKATNKKAMKVAKKFIPDPVGVGIKLARNLKEINNGK
jgi:hypothetical protein